MWLKLIFVFDQVVNAMIDTDLAIAVHSVVEIGVYFVVDVVDDTVVVAFHEVVFVVDVIIRTMLRSFCR